MLRGWVVPVGLSLLAGCSSSYEPARSPRIETVVDGGQPTFVKDGERVGSLTFGTGLVDAVQGNPRAEHHARVGRNLIVGGFVFELAGLGGEIGALAVLAHDRSQGETQASALAVGLLIGGLVATTTGIVMIFAGRPHLYDAINIYNDGVAGCPPAVPAAPLATTASAPAPAAPPTGAPLGPRLQ